MGTGCQWVQLYRELYGNWLSVSSVVLRALWELAVSEFSCTGSSMGTGCQWVQLYRELYGNWLSVSSVASNDWAHKKWPNCTNNKNGADLQSLTLKPAAVGESSTKKRGFLVYVMRSPGCRQWVSYAAVVFLRPVPSSPRGGAAFIARPPESKYSCKENGGLVGIAFGPGNPGWITICPSLLALSLVRFRVWRYIKVPSWN